MLPESLLLWLLLDISSLLLGVQAARNITIDDSKGDGIPTYTPRSAWEDQECGADACWIQPDKLKAYQGTWTGATYNPGSEATYFDLSFEGTAVYIYFIIPNTLPRNPTTATKATFILDGKQDGQPFTHKPDTSNTILYDQLVYSKTGLSQAKHTLRVGIPDKSEQGSYWIGFDYAFVTVADTTTTSSGSPTSTKGGKNSGGSSKGIGTGAIIGAVVAGIVGLAAIIAIVLLLLRRKKQKQKYESVKTFDVFGESAPPSTYQGGHGRDFSDVSAIPLSAAAASTSYYGEHGAGPSSTYSHGRQSSYSHSHSHHESYYDPYSTMGATSAVPGALVPGSAEGANAHQLALRDARQRQLESEVQQMRDQLAALTRQPPAPSAGAVSKQREVDQQEKAQLRAQVQEMQSRIQQMEQAQNSAWAHGISNEPPPGYTPTATT
ncbi:hypothetical protein DL96DRAFT_1243987 [Flagelloscypha sp. PMI_526]|nr:hypothetical protein DL96DRAFT_1243987 [Flagelloscypha sp. PMI_526]